MNNKLQYWIELNCVKLFYKKMQAQKEKIKRTQQKEKWTERVHKHDRLSDRKKWHYM